MSLTLNLESITDEKIYHLLKKPSLIWKTLEPDNPLICDTVKIKSQSISGFIGQLFKTAGISGFLKKDDDIEDSTPACIEHEYKHTCNLETAWHAIHFMLTDNVYDGDFPMNFLLAGGEDVGCIDVGFGPARVIESINVKEINRYLSSLTPDLFMTFYDADNLTRKKIYPEIWYRFYADDENRAYIRGKYELMRSTVERAATHNLGLLIWISSTNLCTMSAPAYAA